MFSSNLILFKMYFLIGIMKFYSSSSMILALISIEMIVLGSFCLYISSWWNMLSVYSIIFFFVIVVIEGVVGLLLLVSSFRDLEIKLPFIFF